MTANELESAALRLTPKERAELAAKLLHSLEDLSDAEIEQLSVHEAERRHAELLAGTAPERPAQDVFRNVRARL